MKPIERIEALLAGKKLDTPLINLWKHFPPYDENPKDLIRKTTQFQERFNWDFVKVTYQGLWSAQDYGTKVKWPQRDCEWPNTCSNVGVVIEPAVKKIEDWKNLKPLSVKEGAMADSIAAAKGIVERFKGEAPVVITMFNPLTTANKMCGNKIITHLRRDPDTVKKGLDSISDSTQKFVEELVKVGADGVFMATQLGTYDMMSEAEYEVFGKPYDLRILEYANEKMWFNIIHMHGDVPMFEMLCKYPAQAINWHDRLVDYYNLKKGSEICKDKILIGGVDEFGALRDGSDEELKAQMKDAIDQVQGERLILGPGCCVPLDVSEDRLELAKKLLQSI